MRERVRKRDPVGGNGKTNRLSEEQFSDKYRKSTDGGAV